MPTLNWIGKEAVVNHHLQVPFHLLKDVPRLACGDPGSGNLIVQGDNLIALKALLPYYAGQVKCIYIDPPYNTGNENWVYNDNVNSPIIRDWLGKVVGGEGETLDRHDRWLCMMYPRLALLKKLLREDGVILVSIDDFEGYRLRMLLDEIFSPQNFIAQLVWDKTRKNDAKLFSTGHEYMLVYAKSLQYLKDQKTVWREQKPGTAEVLNFWKKSKEKYGDDYESIQDSLRDWYKALPKNHPSKKLSRTRWVDKWGPWRDRDISWPGGGGPRYEVIHPVTKKPCQVPERGWGFATPEEMQRQIDIGLVVFREDHTQPPVRKAHLMPIPEEKHIEDGDNESVDAESDDVDNSEAGLLVMSSVIQKQAQVSVKLLRKIFEGRKVFPNPKDHEVIMRLIRYISGPEDIILDSFGGSGTTGHAVLQINKEDEGSNRKFILVEMLPDIAAAVTAERLKRVISGIGDLPPLGGGFRYCELGEPLFYKDGKIREYVSFDDLARHVYFTETGEPLPREKKTTSPFLGECRGVGIYLLYNGILGDKTANGGNVLTRAILAKLPKYDGQKVIYCAGCLLGRDRLQAERIIVRQTPYEIKIS